jgi:hypothetical protein
MKSCTVIIPLNRDMYVLMFVLLKDAKLACNYALGFTYGDCRCTTTS